MGGNKKSKRRASKKKQNKQKPNGDPPSETFENFIDSLVVSSPTVPAHDQEIIPFQKFPFKKCESYMTWTLEPQPDYKKLVDLAQSKFSLLTIQEFTMDPTLYYNEEQVYVNENKLYNFFEHITQFGALAFFNLEIGELLAAKNYMKIALETLAEGIQMKTISQHYNEAFSYVFGLLTLYCSEVEQKLSIQNGLPFTGLFAEFKWVHSVIRSFESFGPEEKAGVYGIKQFYYRMIRMQLNDVLGVIRLAIKLDPDCYEWHLCLHDTLARKRKQLSPKPTYPWRQEKIAVVRANKLDHNHPRCMLAEISYLAEVAQAEMKSVPMKTWKRMYYQDHIFKDILSLVMFIKDKALRIVHLMPTSIAANSTIAEIFTNMLPPDYRDYGFAKTCLDRCIFYNPCSAEANYRMGEYFVTLQIPEAVTHSAEYFYRAIFVDENHYAALRAFVLVLMQNVDGNKAIILESVNGAVNGNKSFNAVQLSSLLFLKGLALFARREHFAAIYCFEDAFNTHYGSLNFASLPYLHNHYLWPTDSGIRLEQIHSQLHRLEGKVRGMNKRQFVRVLISKVREAEEKLTTRREKDKGSYELYLQRRQFLMDLRTKP